eukprot:m.140426 g.140426  ORF g.140426 m.140426 type:complete len:64 (+) comp14947_c1_seq2:180-371(+)
MFPTSSFLQHIFLLDVPDTEVTAVGLALKETMELQTASLPNAVSLSVNVKAGKNWRDLSPLSL